MKTISVIIPSYNRVQELEQVLDSYYAQDNVKEVIVVDDHSSQDYGPVIKKYKEKYPAVITKYIRNEINSGAAASRNVGIKNATSDYILWGEDDAFLAYNYTKILLNFVNEKTVAFGSIYYRITPDMNQNVVDEIIASQQSCDRKLFDFATFEGYYRLITNKTSVPYGHALILVNKTIYNDVQYYEGYRVNGYREETDAQVQMLKMGVDIQYICDAQCYHFPPRKGGQHTSRVIKSDLYKIRNNNIFWNRHYAFLKEKYSLKRGKFIMKSDFILYVLKIHLKGLFYRIKRIRSVQKN